VLTLLFTGLTYAVLSIILSGILSPILTGELQGPLAMPIAIIPVVLFNAVWGLAAGGLALLLQRLRGLRSRDAAELR
jgi:thiamine transporter ThiT